VKYYWKKKQCLRVGRKSGVLDDPCPAQKSQCTKCTQRQKKVEETCNSEFYSPQSFREPSPAVVSFSSTRSLPESVFSRQSLYLPSCRQLQHPRRIPGRSQLWHDFWVLVCYGCFAETLGAISNYF
jgi:hypothetical protein